MWPVSNLHGVVMVKPVLFEAQGGRISITGWAASSFTLVSEWKKPIKWNKKVGLVSNWHGGVMVKAVLFEAKGGEDRFPAGPRALLRWSQNGRNRLGRIKKVWPASN